MYLQLTTRCNMSCAHCCYNCTATGEDMTMETFENALEMCEDYSMSPFLGGGEPTLHKDFLTMLIKAMAASSDDLVGIVTNGSITKTAILLARLTKAEMLHAELSQDDYHDPIHPKVIRAFRELPTGDSHGMIRDTTANREPAPHGRAIELLGYDEENPPELDPDDCICQTWMVKPNGDIMQCGCENSPIIGNVNSGEMHESAVCGYCYLDKDCGLYEE